MPELPFQLTEDQEYIVRKFDSLFVLGRSGSGKTTTLIQKMHWNHHLFATAQLESIEGADEPASIKQLILTV
jgi:hypothetical protein